MRLPGFLRKLLRKNPPEPLPAGIIRLPLATKQKLDFLVFEIGFSIEVRGQGKKFFPLRGEPIGDVARNVQDR